MQQVITERSTSVEPAETYHSKKPAVSVLFEHGGGTGRILGLTLDDALELAEQLVNAVRTWAREAR